MIAPQDETFLRRALRLAMNGRGYVEPNPMVGCVLVRDGQIIGEGWHTHFGGPHAEPTALADCAARGNSPAGATAYVTLEPCCHLNKKTPPCAPRLIKEGIARVVIGCLDPNPSVNGNGVTMLREAGVQVDVAPDAIAQYFRQLIAPFLLAEHFKRPYVTLKWAESADGFVAGVGGKPVRISSDKATFAVHRLRSRCDAIGVGVGTVLTDDPSLTVRDVPSLRTPIRFVLDRTGRMPKSARMLSDGGPTVRIIRDLSELDDLAGRHVLIEPGPTLAAALLPTADRVWVIRASKWMNEGLKGPARDRSFEETYSRTGAAELGGDILTEYLNRRSGSYYGGFDRNSWNSMASADLVLERGDLVPSPGTPGER